MEEFITLAVQKLGIDEATARQATGVVLEFIRKHAAGKDFSQLLEKLPGAQQLLGQSAAGGQGAGGSLLSGALKLAGSALGGETGSALDLSAKLKDSGLDLDKAGSFGSLLMDFVKSKAGDELTGKLLEKVPQLDQILGGSSP
jgi:hypothetical protein